MPTAVVLPLHRSVRDRGTALEPVSEPFGVQLGIRAALATVYRAVGRDSRATVYFVELPHYFDRGGVYGTREGDYPDNALRFGLFCRAALQVLPWIAPRARIVHAHDWHTALACVDLRRRFAGQVFYDRLRSVLSVHNPAFQGWCDVPMLAELGFSLDGEERRAMEWHGRVNLLRGGLTACDMATTVSPTHAAELRTPEGGFGLDEAFRGLGSRLVGILNGIDPVQWNPAHDPSLAARYSAADLVPKRTCKRAAQQHYGLPPSDVPLVAMSARLVEQKGLDLLLSQGLLHDTDAQFVFLGEGEPRYESALCHLARSLSDRVAVNLTFTRHAERALLAGADMLLMPSQFEPCGLTQMRAQRYGCLPIGRRVGGLADTIEDGRTGFLFDAYRSEELHRTVRRATECFRDHAQWHAMMRRAMRRDFGWDAPAAEYDRVYRCARARIPTATQLVSGSREVGGWNVERQRIPA